MAKNLNAHKYTTQEIINNSYDEDEKNIEVKKEAAEVVDTTEYVEVLRGMNKEKVALPK